MYSRVLADVNIIHLIVTRVDEVTIITLTKHTCIAEYWQM
jgi:hypothetical protein